MTTHLARILLIVIGAALAAAAPAAAQLTTPDRQFHNQTSFPLEGRHRAVACESCHMHDVYKGTPAQCFDCHWARRQDDRYRLQLGTQCEQCHRPSGWADTRWDHGAMTAMRLNGAHRQVACTSCHRNSVFANASMACASCHERDYLATRAPNHAAAGFPMTCENCHRASDTSFRGTGFNHAGVFPLAGVHAQQACATCHVNNVYRGTPRECVGCHREAYNRTTAPNHAAAGFSTACETCHRSSDVSWRGSGFNHAAVFPLAGRHAQQACATCHVNNVYRGTPRECVGCHREAYNRTTAPNHPAAGFSTACETCHRNSDVSWRGAGFNHAAVFPLVGVHAQQACASCHRNNVYRGTPRECVGCHLEAYNRTSTPNHLASGFSTACQGCHRATDTTWRQGTFNHRFPIRSGPHRQTCTTCHTSPSNFQAFTCLVCHEHSQPRMDEKHRERRGYRYDSLACYGCHPTGRDD